VAMNPPTSQTDKQADDMRSQDRALHYSASRGNKNFRNRTASEGFVVSLKNVSIWRDDLPCVQFCWGMLAWHDN